MNKEDYKIDPSSIDEKLMLSKTRQDWLNEQQDLQAKLLTRYDMQSKAKAVETIVLMTKDIQAIQNRISYIEELLERWYTDMCIRCAKLTEVDTYCGQPKNCKHCISLWIHNALSNLSDEDLEALDRQLTDLEEGEQS